MELMTLLHFLGLNDKEAATYLALLELGSTTIKPISDRAGVKRTSIYNFINDLVALGLVTKSKKRGRTHYQAASPARLVEIQRERLYNLEERLPEFMQLFKTSGRRPQISYYEGPEEMKNIVREEPRCKKEALYIWPGSDVMGMIGGANFLAEIDRERIKKRVWLRVIRFLHKEVKFRTSADGPEFCREIRFAPAILEVTMGLGIYDTGKVAFISSKKESFGVVVESQEMMILMRSLFRLLWDRSTPARRGEG